MQLLDMMWPVLHSQQAARNASTCQQATSLLLMA
jgi:hypothetical protein